MSELWDIICSPDPEIRNRSLSSFCQNASRERLIAELAPEQRDQYWWKVAMLSMNTAIQEPTYIRIATINLQTALNLNGLLAQPPQFP